MYCFRVDVNKPGIGKILCNIGISAGHVECEILFTKIFYGFQQILCRSLANVISFLQRNEIRSSCHLTKNKIQKTQVYGAGKKENFMLLIKITLGIYVLVCGLYCG